MLQNAYFLAKIGADTAENERNFAENLPKIGNYPTGPLPYGPMTLQKATAEYECARRSQRVFFHVSKSAAPRPAAVKLVLSGMELPNDYLPKKVRKCV